MKGNRGIACNADIIKVLTMAVVLFGTSTFLEADTKTDGAKAMNKQIINSIFSKGEKGPADYFTGTTWVNMLITDGDKVYDTQAYDVRFEPAARTYWHSHPGGQLLFVTSGKGFYQEKGKPARLLLKGDVVEIPPEVMHWHGAAPDSWFVHLGTSTKVHLGPAKWDGPVTDEEYSKATSEQ
jgi:quercetin dioxygenase-like cupin family protein